MKADFFIDRPVFSTVLSIIIVIVGAIGLALLPVDQYPQIVPPVVRVSASYPGADAQTVTQAVATPIEQELNGTPGMIYMESSSSNSGGFSATVTFDISVDPDLAAVDVQNRLKKAEARLPAEVVQNGISVEKQAASKLMTITLLSSDPKFDEIYLSNYATLNVLDLLRRIPGVGSISNVGSRYYAMQIWVQPDKLADLGLTVKDLQSALKDQNRESAAGVLGQAPMTGLDVTIPITAQGRLSSVSEFEDIVIRANSDGSIIRLRDVATISLEASSYNTESGINGGNAAVLEIKMLPGANAMEVAELVKAATEEISEVMKRVRDELSRYPESKVYLSTPAVIPGLGTSGGFEMVLEARGDAGYADLQRAVDTLMHYAEQRPEFTGLASSMQADIPQLYFDVDRDKAQLVGVSMSDIFSTMKAFTGSIYVNDFNMFNRIYRVYIQADAPYRAYRDNLNLFFVRGADGAMIPVTSLGTTHYTTGAGTIKRFNMFNAATITGEAAHGYSSGQAMDELENIVREKLPASVGVEWSGLSYQEKHVSGQTGLVLALAFLFVFLFLAAQYESWSVPVAVILSLPVAGIGAYLGIWVCGLENNIYFQIGLVMLVGLVAKNAILIVEFAKEEVEKGRDVVSAAHKAAHLRFRPIVMTSLAFILGLLPLVFASGPGSASRQGIGTGVFFGMLVAISVGIVFVPFFFVWIYRIKAKLKKR